MTRRPHRPWRVAVVHTIRVTTVAALFAFLPSPHRSADDGSSHPPPPPSERVVELTGGLPLNDTTPDHRGLWPVSTMEDRSIGRSLPDAAEARGYRGPTETLFQLDANERITGVAVLDSHDTAEHVAAVKADREFLSQFVGLTWGGLDKEGNVPKIDGVSGATLTSLAMAKGLMLRLGRARRSLIFDKPASAVEIKEMAALEGTDIAFDIADPITALYGTAGEFKGAVIRTGEFSDEVIGYQGPTELLIAVDERERITELRVRRSFDNEPYVGYVRDDEYFWSRWRDMPIGELATFDPVSEQVEGVSGATMTSMAIAEMLPQVAKGIESSKSLDCVRQPKPAKFASVIDWGKRQIALIRWTARDLVTLGMIVLLWWITSRGWMRNSSLRSWWLIAVVLVIGLWTGNLVSLALITGWASSGVSWQLAIGLVGIVVTAMVMPPLIRGNPYCNHLCPHGAMQQLIRPKKKSWRHVSLSSRQAGVLGWLAPLTFVATYVCLLYRPSMDVSGVEPFHAYLWPMTTGSSLILFVLSLAASLFVPMAYCRFACPSGFLLGYLRRTSVSDRINRWDIALGSLLFLILIDLGQ